MGTKARLIAMVVAGLLAFIVVKVWLDKRASKIPVIAVDTDEYDKESLQHAADLLNRKSPVMVDAVTRLDKTTVEARVVHYHYTLVGETRKAMDVADFQKKLLPILVKGTCDTLRLPIEKGVQMRYSYKDKAGLELFDLVVDAAACKKQA